MNKEARYREQVTKLIIPMIETQLDAPALQVGVSEWSFPIADIEGNEMYVNIKVVVPRARRIDGEIVEYDGYYEHDEYIASKGH